MIKEHLDICSNSFVPNLDTYVDIDIYSKKLLDKAELFVDIDKESNKIKGLVAAYDNLDSKIGWITNVSVDPNYAGQGIGSRLLQLCLDFFIKKDYGSVHLEVFIENKKAISLYKKFNFKTYFMGKDNKKMIMEVDLKKRNYNKELKDTKNHKYAYNFDFDVMHHYMIESFKNHFMGGNCLELGSFKGDFTKRLIPYFNDITCVEASSDAIKIAKESINKNITYINSTFEDVNLPKKYDNIILTHVLEHIDNPIGLLSRIKNEWLSDKGKLFLVCPNANAPSRQIAVKMGLISHNTAITPAEKEHGHRITYTLDTLERDAYAADLNVIHRSGIFFKALANFQWDKLLKTDIITKKYLDGCFMLGQQYPDLCSSIYIICKKNK